MDTQRQIVARVPEELAKWIEGQPEVKTTGLSFSKMVRTLLLEAKTARDSKKPKKQK